MRLLLREMTWRCGHSKIHSHNSSCKKLKKVLKRQLARAQKYHLYKGRNRVNWSRRCNPNWMSSRIKCLTHSIYNLMWHHKRHPSTSSNSKGLQSKPQNILWLLIRFSKSRFCQWLSGRIVASKVLTKSNKYKSKYRGTSKTPLARRKSRVRSKLQSQTIDMRLLTSCLAVVNGKLILPIRQVFRCASKTNRINRGGMSRLQGRNPTF